MRKNRIVSLLISAFLVVAMLPVSCWADDGESVLSGTVVNPLYEDVLNGMPAVGDGGGEMPLLAASSSKYRDKDYPKVTTTDSCAKVFRSAMKKRTTVRFRYTFKSAAAANTANATKLLDESCEKAFEHTGDPCEGEYLRWQYSKYDWSATDPNKSDRDHTYYFSVHFVYYTTAKQEAAVGTKIDEVLSRMNLEGKGEYATVRAIYDYIANNISYDYAGLRNREFKSFTAWKALCKGTAVCQGYSLLMYRMLLECGIDCRIVAADQGSSIAEEGHAWNLIKLNGDYYYGDTTWESTSNNTSGQYLYFLKGNSDFLGHDKYYHIYDYIKNHPVAASRYVPSSDEQGEVIPIVKVLKKTSISKLKSGKNYITVKWTKQQYGVKGYELEYGTKRAFNKGSTSIIRVSDCDKVSKKLTKLKRKTKYYVRVRTYKTVEGVDYYSAWTSKKSLSTK
ncbi:MAG: hypothetical protein KBS56_04035 [Clostridiales bacterium]|nr:hypothetical protein [Candidatus Crickella equi]